MKILEDTISKIFIYQNDNAEYINNICIGYQQKHIVTYHYDSEKEKSLHKKQMKSFGWKEQKKQNKGNINCLQCGEYYKDEIVNFV